MKVFDGLGRKNSGNGDQGGVTFQDALKQVTDNPAECFRAARVNVPNEIMHDQQKTVMHLIRTGQVGGPAMRMIAPILGKMGIKI
jgi:hypothetical protein